MKSLWKAVNSHLSYKLIITIVSLVVLFFGMVVIISYNIFAKEVQKIYVENSSTLLNQLSERTDEYFQSLNDISFSMYADILFLPEYYSDSDELKVYNYKIRKLQNLFLQKRETDSVLLYITEKQELYVINRITNRSFKNAGEIEERDWYQRVLMSPNQMVLEPEHLLENYNSDYGLDDKTPVFSINRCVVEYQTPSFVLSINYRMDALKKMIQDTLVNDFVQILLLNEDGKIICKSETDMYDHITPDLLEILRDNGEKEGDLQYLDEQTGQTLLVLFNKSDIHNTMLLQIVSMRNITYQAEKLKNTIIFISSIIVLMLVIVIVTFSFYITKPLKIIENCMIQVSKGDFSVRSHVRSQDEIGQISNTFNYMTEQIGQLIKERFQLRLKFKDAQLESLHAQINPHFLYNTLQAIGSVACEKEVYEVDNMLMSLSSMLRYTVKSGGNIVTLKDEINNVENYLALQKFRFEDKLNYSINIPEELYTVKVPKLILQPIVENSIVHGIEKLKTPGNISILCQLEEGFCSVIVRDNGVGMKQEDIDKLQKYFNSYNEHLSDEDDKKIGLYNVYQRMLLLYDKKFSMHITSDKMQGVEVRLNIPTENNVLG
ncbi:MAG: sensor histidine kinase [Clostridiaceae bacterium]|nr:sensor histidine kinase [Clostridiaceae bacterium]